MKTTKQIIHTYNLRKVIRQYAYTQTNAILKLIEPVKTKRLINVKGYKTKVLETALGDYDTIKRKTIEYKGITINILSVMLMISYGNLEVRIRYTHEANGIAYAYGDETVILGEFELVNMSYDYSSIEWRDNPLKQVKGEDLTLTDLLAQVERVNKAAEALEEAKKGLVWYVS